MTFINTLDTLNFSLCFLSAIAFRMYLFILIPLKLKAIKKEKLKYRINLVLPLCGLSYIIYYNIS